jgi:N-acetyl-beta-hexosaminidase
LIEITAAGVMLDVARHFFPLAIIRQTIDGMIIIMNLHYHYE